MSLTLNVEEGPLYTISELKVEGDEKVKAEKLSMLDKVNAEAKKKLYPFSKTNQCSKSKHQKYAGKQRYPLADIETKFDLDEAKHQVRVTYKVVKGRQNNSIYRIPRQQLHADKVLRREMAVSEGEVLTESTLQESKRRIANLSYLKDIRDTVVPVEGV